MILTSHSHVEADILGQNGVTGGTREGNITARTMTELAQGGRMEGTSRSKVLVVREGALFSGQASIDLDASGGADGSAYQEDELQTGYEEAVRRAAEWYRSSLFGPTAEPDRSGGQEPKRDNAERGDRSRPFDGLTPERIEGARAEEKRRHRPIGPDARPSSWFPMSSHVQEEPAPLSGAGSSFRASERNL